MKTLGMKKTSSASQKGFTIIELVVVILLLGILTATALPRFMDISDEAHSAVVDGVESGFRTGAALFRATWVAKSEPVIAVAGFGAGALFADPTLGYPHGDNAVFTDSDDCLDIYNGVLQEGRPVGTEITWAGTPSGLETAIEGAAAGTDFAITGNAAAATQTVCNFYYVGQFASGVSAANATIPIITYTPATGIVTNNTSLVLSED